MGIEIIEVARGCAFGNFIKVFPRAQYHVAQCIGNAPIIVFIAIQDTIIAVSARKVFVLKKNFFCFCKIFPSLELNPDSHPVKTKMLA